MSIFCNGGFGAAKKRTGDKTQVWFGLLQDAHFPKNPSHTYFLMFWR